MVPAMLAWRSSIQRLHYFSFVSSPGSLYILYNKNLNWGMKVVGCAVNWNVSSFLINPEQTSLSPVLIDHTTSVMCSITWTF